jgi:hypothetical protein
MQPRKCCLGDKDPEECWLLNYSNSFSFRQGQPALKIAYNSYVIYEVIPLYEAGLITLLYQLRCLTRARKNNNSFLTHKNCLVERVLKFNTSNTKDLFSENKI